MVSLLGKQASQRMAVFTGTAGGWLQVAVRRQCRDLLRIGAVCTLSPAILLSNITIQQGRFLLVGVDCTGIPSVFQGIVIMFC